MSTGAAEDTAATAAWLERDAVESGPPGALAAKLRTAARERRPLRVKLGLDPTAPNIHLGHSIVLRKLREFQDRGHTVVLIVGDYTARVGDPSGRSVTRPMVTPADIERGARTYEEQATLILARERLEVRRNSEWLDTHLDAMRRLLESATVAQILQRGDFSKRLRERQPISILELLYPLLQGYDSVATGADIELGATDQTFNLYFARDVQRAFGRPEQAMMTMPILPGTDGADKMSSSRGNLIGIGEDEGSMRRKLLALPDAVVPTYFELLLERPAPDGPPERVREELADGVLAWLAGLRSR